VSPGGAGGDIRSLRWDGVAVVQVSLSPIHFYAGALMHICYGVDG